LPGQTDVGDAVAVTLGAGFTVTVPLAVAVQPTALVPVTVYVVVEPGETVMPAVPAPVLHEYTAAPEAVKLVFCPGQFEVGETDTETVGTALIFTVADAVDVQPAAVVPVTV
jgi:hypothetical protein